MSAAYIPSQLSELTGSITTASVSDFAEGVDDRVNALVVAGTGITKTYNDASGTLTIAATAAGAASPLTLTSAGAGERPLTLVKHSGQTATVFEVRNSDLATVIFQINADGSIARTDGSNMNIRSGGSIDVFIANVHTFRMGSVGFQPMPVDTIPLGSATQRWSNVFANYHAVCGNAAPADADIATGDAFLWFDSTAGAAKLMVKAKNSSGTVVTGSIALS